MDIDRHTQSLGPRQDRFERRIIKEATGASDHLPGARGSRDLIVLQLIRRRRLLEPIGHVPPAEAEAAYYRELEEPTPIAA